jgi:TolA-binding protein
MQNSVHGRILTCLATLLVAAGCAPNNKAAKSALDEGFTALEARQYDQAITRAEAFLKQTPKGEGTAEALYLKGRAYEQKPAANIAEARANLQNARTSYLQALKSNPPRRVEALVHTGLANVAYFQDDYASAAIEWTTAYDKLDEPEHKSWALYRLGLSRQRLGQFNDADKVFISVQEKFPGTVPAQRAREHAGVRAFSVQFATFATPQLADSAITTLRREGVMATRQTSSGRNVVTSAPITSYQQALSLKAKYISRFPDAVVVP